MLYFRIIKKNIFLNYTMKCFFPQWKWAEYGKEYRKIGQIKRKRGVLKRKDQAAVEAAQKNTI